MAKIKIKNSFLVYSEEQDEIILDLLYVDPAERRQGIGTQLVQKLQQLSQIAGKPITLYAEPQENNISKADLIAFYEKLGFSQDYN